MCHVSAISVRWEQATQLSNTYMYVLDRSSLPLQTVLKKKTEKFVHILSWMKAVVRRNSIHGINVVSIHGMLWNLKEQKSIKCNYMDEQNGW